MILALLGFLFVVLVAIGVPISFAVGAASVVATLLLPGVDNATIVQRMLTSINTFPLLAVIFFVFAGVLMSRGGIARRLVMMAEVLVGRLPGSLAQIVCVASMFFGGVTGSAVAEVSSIGGMMIPAMEKDGYSRRFATAIVLTAATMGPIIPPSIGMIVFAHVAGSVSIAALFLAGVVPGVLIGVSLMAASFVHGKLYHRKTLPELPRREKIRRVVDGMAGVFTMVIILGGIISGVFTATEAGAAASVYALVLTVFVYREIKLSELPEILWECCLTNAVVMMLIATCSVFAWILTYENLPTLLAENFFNLIHSKWAFLLLLNVFLLDRRHVRRHDAGVDHAGSDADPAGPEVRHRPRPSRPRHGDQPRLRPDHAAGRHGAVRGAQGRQAADGEDHRAAPAAARLHDGRAAVRDLCSGGLHVAAAELRAGEVNG